MALPKNTTSATILDPNWRGSGDSQPLIKNPDYIGGTATILDPDWKGSGDAQPVIKNPDYIAPVTYSVLEAAPLPTTFASQNAIGTADYSKDISGYLNALSPSELLSLGPDFNISGLARSDLGSLSPYSGGGGFFPEIGYQGGDGSLKYSPEQLHEISKYRNVSTLLDGGWNELGNPNSVNALDAYGNDITSPLWVTRNYRDGVDDLYRYTDGGGFERAGVNEEGYEYGNWWDTGSQVFKAGVLAVLGAASAGALSAAAGGAAAAGAGGAAAGGGGAAAGGAAAGSTMGPVASLAAAQSAAGITSAAGGGAAALGGSGAAAGGSFGAAGSPGGFNVGGYGPGNAGGGITSLNTGTAGASLGPAGSPGGYNTGGYGPGNPGGGITSLDPSSAAAIDFGGGTDWAEMAKRAKKVYDQFSGGGAQAPQPSWYQPGSAGNALGGGSGGDYEAQNALGYTPYRLPARQNTLGYIDRLRSQ